MNTLKKEIKKNSLIYYKDANGETHPTEVLERKNDRIKIELNDFRIVWVSVKNCELQKKEKFSLTKDFKNLVKKEIANNKKLVEGEKMALMNLLKQDFRTVEGKEDAYYHACVAETNGNLTRLFSEIIKDIMIEKHRVKN